MWMIILSSQKTEEGGIAMSFHLISEFIMALLSIAGGIFLLSKKDDGSPLSCFALGMILYSVLNAEGYYAQRRELPFMILFIALTLLTVLAFALLFLNARKQFSK
jgi:hypothetical protein